MKRFLLLTIILLAPQVFAYDNYVSPESYAVNEADFQDYRYIPPSPRLNLEMLEQQPTIEPVIQTQKSEKVKKVKEEDPEAYKKRMSYKFAKWWVNQRYKREEIHHGTKHEIKVKAREEYEKRLEEKIN